MIRRRAGRRTVAVALSLLLAGIRRDFGCSLTALSAVSLFRRDFPSSSPKSSARPFNLVHTHKTSIFIFTRRFTFFQDVREPRPGQGSTLPPDVTLVYHPCTWTGIIVIGSVARVPRQYKRGDVTADDNSQLSTWQRSASCLNRRCPGLGRLVEGSFVVLCRPGPDVVLCQ